MKKDHGLFVIQKKHKQVSYLLNFDHSFHSDPSFYYLKPVALNLIKDII